MKTHIRKAPIETRKAKFLEYLARGWTIGPAARQADFVPSQIYRMKADDEEFAAAWDDAYREGTDMLEMKAQQRGFDGVLKPVYQQGRRVGTVREYSDPMATLILKKRNPEFKDRIAHEGSGKDGAFIVHIGERESKV